MSHFLEGKAIYLRPFRKEDIKIWFDWFNDPLVTRHMNKGILPNTEAKQEEYFEKLLKSKSDLQLAICLKKDDALIGIVGVHKIDPVHRNGDVSIIIGNRDHWGRGFAKEAIGLIVKHAFTKMNLERLTAGMPVTNKGSRKCFEGNGFTLEGTRRKHFFYDGSYVDVCLFGLLREEWKKSLRIKSMATGAFLVARMGSARLKGKNTAEILGKPMIEHLVGRVRRAALVDKIIITTSTEKTDDVLEEIAEKLGVKCYRGALNNVMQRVSNAADALECDTIVELLGDNTLVHSALIDDVIKLYRDRRCDYCANVTKEYPISRNEVKLFSVGVRVQVYSASAARKWKKYPAYTNDPDKSTTAFMFEQPDIFKISYLEAKGRWEFMNKPDFTFAVNYFKNLELIRIFFGKHYPKDKNFPLEIVYKQLEDEPNLAELMGNE